MENRSGGNGNLLLLIVLVVIGYFAFKAGYIQMPGGGDGSSTPQPVTVEPMIVPSYLETPTAVSLPPTMTPNVVQYYPDPTVDTHAQMEAVNNTAHLAAERFQQAFTECNATRVAGFPNEQDACDDEVAAYATVQAQLKTLAGDN